MFFPLRIILVLFGLMRCSSADEQPSHNFVLDKFEKQLEADDIFKLQLSAEKLEKDVKISGEAVQSVDMDNDWMLSIVLYSADTADDEYELLIGIKDRGVCDMMATYYKIFFYKSLQGYVNAPPPDDCPVVSDTYVLKYYPIDVRKLSSYLDVGYYRIKASLQHNGEDVIIYVLDGHVIEE